MPVRRKPSGRWEVRVSIGSGRRVERTLPAGATRRDAERLEQQLRATQIAIESGRQPNRLIDDAIKEWLDTGGRSLRSYERDIRYRLAVLQEHTRGRTIEQIPAVAADLSRAGLKAGLKPASINRYLSILRRVGNLCVRWGWTDTPVGQRVKLLPGEVQRHVYLTAEQVQALMAHCTPELADMIRFAVLTGMRRGEMMRITPESIVDDCVVLDATTKSGKPRVIPLPAQARQIARTRLPWPLTVWEYRNGFERAREAAGMPHVRIHDLRHTYASWLAQGGASMTAIRDLMGHSSLAVTSRYAHLARPDLVKAARKLKI